MKIIRFILFALFIPLTVMAQDEELCKKVVLETDSGNVVIMLYNDTPLHRDNFIKLVEKGFYDGVLFHRVINRFMIQTGDSASRHAKPGVLLGESGYETYKIPAEIRWPQHFHKKGAVAAAREGNATNPQWESSMCQFYIVTGRRFNDTMLDDASERIFRDTRKDVSFPQELRDVYMKTGGTPHLDTQYTVFGEVVEGLDVVDRIQVAETDSTNRPITDIHIKHARVME